MHAREPRRRRAGLVRRSGRGGGAGAGLPRPAPRAAPRRLGLGRGRGRRTRAGGAMSPLVAGVDEAGRGPLAGPVVVAAVILDPARPIEGLDDSKKLTEKRREALYPLIVDRALAHRIEFVGCEEI